MDRRRLMLTDNVDIDWSQEYLTFELPPGGNNNYITINISSGISVECSIDNGPWQQWSQIIYPSSTETKIIRVRGTNTNYSDNTGFFDDDPNVHSYITVKGNIMSLIYGDNFRTATYTPYNNRFRNLFRTVGVVSAKDLILPSMEVGESEYEGMFSLCNLLVYPPKLPATTLAKNCYKEMFRYCNLLLAPELPATTLADSCYSSMFSSCTGLTTAPELPATILVSNCYKEMFSGCTNLNYIKAMFTTTPGSVYTQSWVNNVASSGIFVKNSEAQWNVTGIHGVPSGWTIQNA